MFRRVSSTPQGVCAPLETPKGVRRLRHVSIGGQSPGRSRGIAVEGLPEEKREITNTLSKCWIGKPTSIPISWKTISWNPCRFSPRPGDTGKRLRRKMDRLPQYRLQRHGAYRASGQDGYRKKCRMLQPDHDAGTRRHGAWPIETPTMIRFGQLTHDEYFVTESTAREGVTIHNPSRTDPIVMLKTFGPKTRIGSRLSPDLHTADPLSPAIGFHWVKSRFFRYKRLRPDR